MIPPVIPNPLPGLYGKGKRTGPYKDRQWISVAPLVQELHHIPVVGGSGGEWGDGMSKCDYAAARFTTSTAGTDVQYGWRAGPGFFWITVDRIPMDDAFPLALRLGRIIAPASHWLNDSLRRLQRVWDAERAGISEHMPAQASYGVSKHDGYSVDIAVLWRRYDEYLDVSLTLRPDRGVVIPVVNLAGETIKLLVGGRDTLQEPQ